MESPFFRSHWNPNPLRHGYFPQERQPRPSKPKVVSIPVHFVQPEKTKVAPAASRAAVSKEAAAVKIQKVFRGFLVRKNVRTVRKIAAEVDEIERRVRAEQDLIRREAKERLRVSEMLMALLFRLDSVRGVRDYRKKVIRRVISLQEAVDSISTAPSSDGSPMEMMPQGLDRKADASSASDLEAEEEAKIPAESREIVHESEDRSLKPTVASDLVLDAAPESVVAEKEEGEAGEEMIDESADRISGTPESVVIEKEEVEAGEKASLTVESMDDAPGIRDLTERSTIDTEVGKVGDPMEETVEIPESTPLERMEVETPKEEMESLKSSGDGDGDGDGGKVVMGMKEVMERVAEESERLKGLVAELCERSAQQCRLMGGLAQRVEELERVVQKMERKKKKTTKNKKRNAICPPTKD